MIRSVALSRCFRFQHHDLTKFRFPFNTGAPFIHSASRCYSAEANKASVEDDTKKKNISSLIQLGLFTVAIYATSRYFFNLQRQRSVVMHNVLFRMRTNEMLKNELGQNIDLAGFKWIRGDINDIKGFADVTFEIVGSKGIKAKVQLKMQRYPHDRHRWQTTELYLTLPDNRTFNGYIDEDTEQLILQ